MPYSDPERKKAADRAYNKERWPQLTRERPLYGLVRNAQHRSRKNGLPCDLTEENIPPLPVNCPCCGVKMQRGGVWREQPSLDRAYPERGYVVANVAWLCRRCNQLKNNASLEEMRAVVAYMERLQNVNEG